MKSRRATIVIGLGYGDCGKGSVVDYLAGTGEVHTVVRFNGGPQAGHNVVTPQGHHHTFSQFGSGTLGGPSIATFLSRFMLIEPYAMLNEAEHLQQLGCENVWDRLSIDARCVVITPAHQAMNRLRELARGPAAHGTCGQGIGEATEDAVRRPDLTLFAGECSNRDLVARKLRATVRYKAQQLRSFMSHLNDLSEAADDLNTILRPQWIEVAVDACVAIAGASRILSAADADAILCQPGDVIFEGAQGVLLDEDFGFHPHTTWSRTTAANAVQLLREAGITAPPRRIGVLRSYMTRHGAGPLVTESKTLGDLLVEPHNNSDGRQGCFRMGVFDVVAARYALKVSPVDEIALTHLDALPTLPRSICIAYHPDPTDAAFLGNGPFRDIPIPDPTDFPKRTALTAALNRCKPVLTEADDFAWQTFVSRIQCELSIPILLLSFGPMSSDKCQLMPL